jgi:hypothetical protein
MEFVQELYLDKELAKDPKKLNETLNFLWLKYLKGRLKEFEKESKEEFLLFRSQIQSAIKKINSSV